MSFTYKHADVSANPELAGHISRSAQRLADRLRAVDIDSLAVSGYGRYYLGHQLATLESTLARYAFVIYHGLRRRAPAELGDLTVLEYGGGTGVMSLLLREMGVGRVVYNDIDPVTAEDGAAVADAIELTHDLRIVGDTDAVLAGLAEHEVACDHVVSWDVLEHVYDIEAFLAAQPRFSSGALSVAHASSANGHNPIIWAVLGRKARQVEMKDRPDSASDKMRDTNRAYRSLRREHIGKIVADAGGDVAEDVLDQLAARSRGLNLDDTAQLTRTYLATGTLPPRPDHPFNTCDPRTGNWAERLLDTKMLQALLQREGFEAEVVAGWWGTRAHPAKRAVAGVLDLVSRVPGLRMRAAPFYVLVGTRTG